jgi:hypothetical protein
MMQNKNIKYIDVGEAGSLSIIEDPKAKELRAYYRNKMISAEEFRRLYECLPITYVIDSPKVEYEEEDEPIKTRWEILDI